MRPPLFTATLLSSLLIATSSSFASIEFFLGNGPFTTAVNNAGLDLENILVNKDEVGLIVDGLTNTTNVLFDIMGNQSLTNTANGQATVEGTDGPFTSAMIFAHDAGVTFQALEFTVTPEAKAGGTYTLEVFGNFPSGPTTSFTFATSNPQFVGVVATDGMLINKVSFTSSTPNNIADMKHIRVAGVEEAVIPEPASVAVWGLILAAGAIWYRFK